MGTYKKRKSGQKNKVVERQKTRGRNSFMPLFIKAKLLDR